MTDPVQIPGASSPPLLPEQMTFPVPPLEGRMLGIDFGDKRFGFAVSNFEQTIASPIENYNRRSPSLDLQQIKRWCQEYTIKGVVIGLPIHMSGLESQKSIQCRRFAAVVHEATQLPVALHDERCTTAVVIDHLIELDMSRKQRKKKLDMLAAQVLLQSFLDSRKPPRNPEPADSDTEYQELG